MNGATIINAFALSNPGPSWTITGIGDFNGDGTRKSQSRPSLEPPSAIVFVTVRRFMTVRRHHAICATLQ
jgi:hypothetical protein